MKTLHSNSKLLLFITLIFILIFSVQCAIYRTREFNPEVKIKPFENWNIKINISAYKGSSSANPETDHEFSFYLCASTYKDGWGTRPGSYLESNYKAKIKAFKLFYGEDFSHEIPTQFHEIDTWAPEDKETCIESSQRINIAKNIKLIKVVTDVEYLYSDKSILKEYSIILKRHDSSMLFMAMD